MRQKTLPANIKYFKAQFLNRTNIKTKYYTAFFHFKQY